MLLFWLPPSGVGGTFSQCRHYLHNDHVITASAPSELGGLSWTLVLSVLWCFCRLSEVLDTPLHTATFYFLLQLGGHLAAQEAEADEGMQLLDKQQQQQVGKSRDELFQEHMQPLRAFPGNQLMRWLARSAANTYPGKLLEIKSYTGRQVSGCSGGRGDGGQCSA